MLKVKYLIFGLFAGILLLNFNLVSAKELVREAKVILVKGDVNIQKAGKTDWVKAKEGMILTDGDTAKTAKSAVIEIAFDRDKKNIVRLDENSTAILRGKMLKQVELPRGKIRFVVKSLKRDSSFEIKTPTVVAGARGSGGDVIARENEDTVRAQEDELFVQSFDEQGNMIQEISLTEGMEVNIERFEAPGEIMEITGADRGDWGSWKEDLGGRIEESIKEEQPAPTQENISQVESIQQETTQKQGEYKQDIIQQDDTQRIETALEEETPKTTGSTSPSGY
ncbi:MAG: FecR domain-containing protein [Candidatus Omnitrophota bacterium]|nr:FecR domain-containing protein [Candidatus Omnitrophota bacterium]